MIDESELVAVLVPRLRTSDAFSYLTSDLRTKRTEPPKNVSVTCSRLVLQCLRICSLILDENSFGKFDKEFGVELRCSMKL